MTFLLIVFSLRFVFVLLNRAAKRKDRYEMSKYEEGPSEHNVWW